MCSVSVGSDSLMVCDRTSARSSMPQPPGWTTSAGAYCADADGDGLLAQFCEGCGCSSSWQGYPRLAQIHYTYYKGELIVLQTCVVHRLFAGDPRSSTGGHHSDHPGNSREKGSWYVVGTCH